LILIFANSNHRLIFVYIQVRLLIELKQTEHIETVAIALCIEFKLFDKDVCRDGMHEYQVKLPLFVSFHLIFIMKK